MALAVFVRSPAAYEALKGFGLMQLPSRSTLLAYTGAFLDEAGYICDPLWKKRPLVLKYDFSVGGSILDSYFWIFFLSIF